MPLLVEMRRIKKSFGEVQALKGVDMKVHHPEVVGLVGDNGAGKSTLIKILTGVYKPDEGEIIYKGKKVNFSSPKEPRDLGIEPVHQQGALIDEEMIWENFFLGKEIKKRVGPFKFLDKGKMKKEAKRVLDALGVDLNVEAKVGPLSGGEKQAVTIGRAMYFGGDLLVLDEPTASLSLRETENVLKHLRSAKEAGYSVILISHLTRHVYPVADRFVILEKGEKIEDVRKSKITRKELEQIIVSGRLKTGKMKSKQEKNLRNRKS